MCSSDLAAVLMLLDNLGHPAEHQTDNVTRTFSEVEWITIFFFVGLFMVVHGVEVAGVLKLAADLLEFRNTPPRSGLVADFNQLSSVAGMNAGIMNTLQQECYLAAFAIRRQPFALPREDVSHRECDLNPSG
mgnify:CR=1 FL=1